MQISFETLPEEILKHIFCDMFSRQIQPALYEDEELTNNMVHYDVRIDNKRYNLYVKPFEIQYDITDIPECTISPVVEFDYDLEL